MEAQFIAWLRSRLPAPPASLLIGPGDDAAVIDTAKMAGMVATTDMLMDGVDFRLSQVDPRRIGRKALAVNLSDLAAMGSEPVAALVSLSLPRSGGFALARELYEGLLPLAEEFGAAIAGGDTNAWDGPLVISITALGRTTSRGPLLRSGAKAGDAVVVTGELGGSILGKHFDFTPRVREAIALASRYEIHAAMDISDGLLLDLSRLCAESGCGAELELSAIPIAAAAYQLAELQADSCSALDHAVADGEDFELLLALAANDAANAERDQPLLAEHGVRLTPIGRFISEAGIWSVDAAGVREKLEPRGYQHQFD
ncbi:MAG: thiamine-monophosphate kinase [Pirellula sp.]|nr:thiamine-monophosphate kinase [Pirellula sp.]